MRIHKDLKVVRAQNDQPLHLAVSDALRRAIDSGVFPPTQRLPSTQKLSAEMKVSLVTTHRALKELAAGGVIERTQGRGTYIQPRYLERLKLGTVRVGVIVGVCASLADYHYGQIVEGVRSAAEELGVDHVVSRLGQHPHVECNGNLLVGMLASQVERIASRNRLQPIVSMDCHATTRLAHSLDIDNAAMSGAAVAHLVALGHRRIAYVGCDDGVCNGAQRWEGFIGGCQHHGLALRQQHVLRALKWHLDEREQTALVRMLADPERPTAIYASGFTLAVDAYRAAATLGLNVPGDLSILGVDDPPSAAYLSPPLTTFRQPLQQLGRAGVEALIGLIRRENGKIPAADLPCELVVRGSTASLRA